MFKRLRISEWVDGSLRCSFCGLAKREVGKLIAGPGVCICDECVGVCSEIIEREQAPATSDNLECRYRSRSPILAG